jgi:hypothetical protein
VRDPFWNYPKRDLAHYTIKKEIALIAAALVCIYLRLKKSDRRSFLNIDRPLLITQKPEGRSLF